MIDDLAVGLGGEHQRLADAELVHQRFGGNDGRDVTRARQADIETQGRLRQSQAMLHQTGGVRHLVVGILRAEQDQADGAVILVRQALLQLLECAHGHVTGLLIRRGDVARLDADFHLEEVRLEVEALRQLG
jgi:hypothetical protein